MRCLLQSLFVILAFLVCSCNSKKEQTGEAVAMRYAENISIRRLDGCTVVSMKNPWREGQVLHSYVLIDRADSARMAGRSLPEGTVVYTPLRRSVVFNTAHAQLVSWLGDPSPDPSPIGRGALVDGIAGVADLKYMLLPHIHKLVEEGRIADCGNSLSPDIERIVALHADGILLSPFENSGGYGRLEQIGVPIIECAEYMETSPLGRAEWMRFYGMLYGKEREADSLFAVVEKEYQGLKELTAHPSLLKFLPSGRLGGGLPMLLTEKLTGSTWYVPGGKSTVAQLIADAGASYAWSCDEHSGSLALSYETVVSKAGDADVWIFNNYGAEPTYESLAAEYHGYRIIKAYKEHRVWYVNSMAVPYFEEVSFRPDRLLRDYIIMLHPGLLQGRTRYYRELGVRS